MTLLSYFSGDGLATDRVLSTYSTTVGTTRTQQQSFGKSYNNSTISSNSNSQMTETFSTYIMYETSTNDISKMNVDHRVLSPQWLKNNLMNIILGVCGVIIFGLVVSIIIIVRRSRIYRRSVSSMSLQSEDTPQPRVSQHIVGIYAEIDDLAISDHLICDQSTGSSSGSSDDSSRAMPRGPYNQLENVTVKDEQVSTYTGLGNDQHHMIENEGHDTADDTPQREEYEQVSRQKRETGDYTAMGGHKVHVIAQEQGQNIDQFTNCSE